MVVRGDDRRTSSREGSGWHEGRGASYVVWCTDVYVRVNVRMCVSNTHNYTT